MRRPQHLGPTLVLAWAASGAAIAWRSFGEVTADARAFVGLASVVGPLVAVVAAGALHRGNRRVAGLLLVVSAATTPTYFAWPLSAVALSAGVLLALSGRGSRTTHVGET